LPRFSLRMPISLLEIQAIEVIPLFLLLLLVRTLYKYVSYCGGIVAQQISRSDRDLFLLTHVIQILVLCFFGALSCILLWQLWFTTFLPFSRLKLEFRKKRWDFKIDGDGLQYTVRGRTGNQSWEANWNGHLPHPVLELTLPGEAARDRWVFLLSRTARSGPVSSLVADAFTGNAPPPWAVGLSQATEINTNTPEFEQRFVLPAFGTKGVSRLSFPSELLSRLRMLPETVLRGLTIILGDGELRVRIEGFHGGAEIAPFEQLAELARHFGEWYLAVTEVSRRSSDF